MNGGKLRNFFRGWEQQEWKKDGVELLSKISILAA